MSRFRHRCSSRYLRISPLHLEFHSPLPSSSPPVSDAVPRLSRGISHLTERTAYALFMPSNSEQRSHPPSYRGCWHGVSRCFLSLWSNAQILTTRSSYSVTAVYNPKAFILHAVSLHQAFAHCGRFSTAASRRSLGSVSVPVWPITLSGPLPVSLGEPLPHQQADRIWAYLFATGSEESPPLYKMLCST